MTDGNTSKGMYSFDISYVDQATDRSNFAVEHLSAASILTQIRPNNGLPPDSWL